MTKFYSYFQKRPYLAAPLIFLFALFLRSIKAGFFPLNPDEMFAVNASTSLGKAIEQSHADLVPPFLNVTNTFLYHLDMRSDTRVHARNNSFEQTHLF